MNEEQIARWRILKGHILSEIKEIDDSTKWEDKEPAWWLEMRKIQKILLNSKV